MIFILERNWMYGYRKGEWLDYKYLELYLWIIYLEVNDIFVMLLFIVNISCVMELFLINGGILKRIIYFVWLLIFYNIGFIILCFFVVILF